MLPSQVLIYRQYISTDLEHLQLAARLFGKKRERVVRLCRRGEPAIYRAITPFEALLPGSIDLRPNQLCFLFAKARGSWTTPVFIPPRF